jgi:hypothetical protein
VTVVFAFSGAFLLVPAAIAAVVLAGHRRTTASPALGTCGNPRGIPMTSGGS